MTLIWLTLAFIAGAFFWHKFGGWVFRRFGLQGSLRADLVRNLNTDTLVSLHQATAGEIDRRDIMLGKAR